MVDYRREGFEDLLYAEVILVFSFWFLVFSFWFLVFGFYNPTPYLNYQAGNAKY